MKDKLYSKTFFIQLFIIGLVTSVSILSYDKGYLDAKNDNVIKNPELANQSQGVFRSFDRLYILKSIASDARRGSLQYSIGDASKDIPASKIEWVTILIDELPGTKILAAAFMEDPTTQSLLDVYEIAISLSEKEIALIDSDPVNVNKALKSLKYALNE